MATANNELHQDYLKTVYRCITESRMICHDMVEEHKVVYIMSGRLTLRIGNKKVDIQNGEAVFVRKNHLVKEFKQPGLGGEPFKGLFLHLHTSTLKNIASRIELPGAHAGAEMKNALAIPLPSHPFLKGLFYSLDQYFSTGTPMSEELIDAKVYETVLVLLELMPELSEMIFDFCSQWKIDLKEFMEKNYLCDLSIEQFAHYAGRSLSGFKRDFKDIFGMPPHRWILQKRLDAAYGLLAEGGCCLEDVCLRTGFKNSSHFATVFKKRFGITPTEAKSPFPDIC